jgi:hypothetical protein
MLPELGLFSEVWASFSSPEGVSSFSQAKPGFVGWLDVSPCFDFDEDFAPALLGLSFFPVGDDSPLPDELEGGTLVPGSEVLRDGVLLIERLIVSPVEELGPLPAVEAGCPRR